jgi:hypothetical protein
MLTKLIENLQLLLKLLLLLFSIFHNDKYIIIETIERKKNTLATNSVFI